MKKRLLDVASAVADSHDKGGRLSGRRRFSGGDGGRSGGSLAGFLIALLIQGIFILGGCCSSQRPWSLNSSGVGVSPHAFATSWRRPQLSIWGLWFQRFTVS